MGIVGIYKEIGPGQRIALSKLAAEHLAIHNRPLRLAIDVSIWHFQVQASRGGANPALRTIFYRLARLLGLGIAPLFVFDGPQKPAFKRGQRSDRPPATRISNMQTKVLIRLFGFAVHDAPGEAEAECALLQRQGVVDAVLSEDVDTLMFGCRRMVRSWTPERKAGGTFARPTHVSMYDVGEGDGEDKGAAAMLTREGMVLVALMSGGDYLPEGVPRCGIKVACAVARAGFGEELCGIRAAEWEAGAARWRERLRRELVTNESGFFPMRRKSVKIPESFPSLEILRYYTHPVVSGKETVERVRAEFGSKAVDVEGLREFVRDMFDWSGRLGVVKLIRVIAPQMVVPELLNGGDSDFVQEITNRRTHPSADFMPELRVSFIPVDMVGIDPNDEPEEAVPSLAASFGRDGLALNSDDVFEAAGETETMESSQAAKSKPTPFDPFAPCLVWVPETVARKGAPLAVEEWEAKQSAKLRKKTTAASKSPRKTRGKRGVDSTMPQGALDRFVKVMKKM